MALQGLGTWSDDGDSFTPSTIAPPPGFRLQSSGEGSDNPYDTLYGPDNQPWTALSPRDTQDYTSRGAQPGGTAMDERGNAFSLFPSRQVGQIGKDMIKSQGGYESDPWGLMPYVFMALMGGAAAGGLGGAAGAEGLAGAEAGAAAGGGFSADAGFLSTKDMLFPGLASPTGGFSAAPGFQSTLQMLSSTPSFNFGPETGGGGGVNPDSLNGGLFEGPGFASDTGFTPGSFDLGTIANGGPAASGLTGGGAESPIDMLKRLYKQSSPYRGAYDVGSGIYNMFKGNQMSKLAAPGMEASKQLQYMMANPQAVQSLPGYAERQKAVARLMAARGYNMSGNEMTALAKEDMGFRGEEMDRLARISQGSLPASVASNQLQGNSINRILYGLSRMAA